MAQQAGTALYDALWPYVEGLTEPGPPAPRIESASYSDVAAIYGTGSAARKAMADALGLTPGPEGSPERRARQSFLEAARRWERGDVSNPSKARGFWRRLVQAAGTESRTRKAAGRRMQLDTLSSMIADRGLLISRLEANYRVSRDERDRDIKPGASSGDDDEEPSVLAQGIYLSPEILEEADYGPAGENLFRALDNDDWETAALCVFSAFFEEYTEGATGGYATFIDDVETLDIEIP